MLISNYHTSVKNQLLQLCCEKPLQIFKKDGTYALSRCGSCPACLRNKRNVWASRCKDEQLTCDLSLFLTLTYNDDCLPRIDWKAYGEQMILNVTAKNLPDYKLLNEKILTRSYDINAIKQFCKLRSEKKQAERLFITKNRELRYISLSQLDSLRDNMLYRASMLLEDNPIKDYQQSTTKPPIFGHGVLLPTDLQNFIKRLRRHLGNFFEITYYACGEYGGETDRPHFHALLFFHKRHIDEVKALLVKDYTNIGRNHNAAKVSQITNDINSINDEIELFKKYLSPSAKKCITTQFGWDYHDEFNFKKYFLFDLINCLWKYGNTKIENASNQAKYIGKYIGKGDLISINKPYKTHPHQYEFPTFVYMSTKNMLGRVKANTYLNRIGNSLTDFMYLKKMPCQFDWLYEPSKDKLVHISQPYTRYVKRHLHEFFGVNKYNVNTRQLILRYYDFIDDKLSIQQDSNITYSDEYIITTIKAFNDNIRKVAQTSHDSDHDYDKTQVNSHRFDLSL